MEEHNYEVRLDIFEGPLDVLLNLIEVNEYDIYDIPIAAICEQYLAFVELMKELSLDLAGEFLVMASTLVQIKSKMLLPKSPLEEDEDDDPRTLLVEQIVEHKKMKQAAVKLQELEEAHQRSWPRTVKMTKEMYASEELLINAGLPELLEAFKKLLERSKDTGQEIKFDIQTISIKEKMTEILEHLESYAKVSLSELAGHNPNRIEIIATFLAILELVKMQVVSIFQNKSMDEIYLLVKESQDEDTGTEIDD